MDPRLLRYYNQELGHLREMGAEFARAVPEDRGAPRHGRHRGHRPVRRAAARRRRVPRRARAAQARRRVSALHATAARDRLPELSRADAGDAGAPAPARADDAESRAGLSQCRAARASGMPAASGGPKAPREPTTTSARRRVPHRARRDALADRDRSKRSISRMRRTCRWRRFPPGRESAAAYACGCGRPRA